MFLFFKEDIVQKDGSIKTNEKEVNLFFLKGKDEQYSSAEFGATAQSPNVLITNESIEMQFDSIQDIDEMIQILESLKETIINHKDVTLDEISID